MAIIINKDARLVTIVQAIQAVLCVATFAIGIYKFSNATRPSRVDLYPIIVSVKSLVLLVYELGAEHWGPMRRFASLRAYKIISIVEVVFWFAAIVVSFLGLRAGCSGADGTICIMGGVIICLISILFVISLPMCALAIRNRSYFKKHGCLPGEETATPNSTTGFNMQTRNQY